MAKCGMGGGSRRSRRRGSRRGSRRTSRRGRTSRSK